MADVAICNLPELSIILRVCKSDSIKPLTAASSGPILPDNVFFAVSLATILLAIASAVTSLFFATFFSASFLSRFSVVIALADNSLTTAVVASFNLLLSSIISLSCKSDAIMSLISSSLGCNFSVKISVADWFATIF